MAACWRLTWFVYITSSVLPEKATGNYGAPGWHANLQQPWSVVGPSVFETYTYATTLSSLIISSPGSSPGSFRLQPPVAPVSLALLGVAASFSWSRQLRPRC